MSQNPLFAVAVTAILAQASTRLFSILIACEAGIMIRPHFTGRPLTGVRGSVDPGVAEP